MIALYALCLSPLALAGRTLFRFLPVLLITCATCLMQIAYGALYCGSMDFIERLFLTNVRIAIRREISRMTIPKAYMCLASAGM